METYESRKLLKLLLTFVAWIAAIWYQTTLGKFELLFIPIGWAMACFLYLFCSLFGFILSAVGNFLTAIIYSIVIGMFCILKLSAWTKKYAWFTEDMMLYGAMIIASLWIIKDIIHFVRKDQAVRSAAYIIPNEQPIESEQQTTQYKTVEQVILENPQAMLQVSQQFERYKGHKPTYEELVAYVYNELLHVKTDEEIRAEAEELRKRRRKQESNQNQD